jgi:hypothetical protein
MSNISTFGLTYLLSTNLINQKSSLASLNQQLASGKKQDNLTAYAPTDAKNIIDYNNSITQKQSYLDSIQTVQNRLSIYDSTLTNLSSIAQDAANLSSQNQNYNASTAANLQSQAKTYLLQTADDLNQKSGSRYVYSGIRYNTQPVSNSTTVLNGSPQAIITNGTNLPDYDAEVPAKATSKVSYGAALAGSATVGFTSSTATKIIYDASGTSHSLNYTWSKTSPTVWSLSVESPDATYSATVPFTFDSSTGTLSSIASSTAYTIGTPTTSGNSADVDISLTFAGQSAQSIDLNFGYYGTAAGTGELTNNSTATTISQNLFTQDGKAVTTTDANAYTADSVKAGDSYSVTYGISSDDPSFQKLINGLRYMNAAVIAGNSGDKATYQSEMNQASTLLKEALSGIQTLNSQVANNQNMLKQQTKNLNSDINNLTDSLGFIQNADTTQVAATITILQTQLQASYSATGSLLKLSLANYL